MGDTAEHEGPSGPGPVALALLVLAAPVVLDVVLRVPMPGVGASLAAAFEALATAAQWLADGRLAVLGVAGAALAAGAALPGRAGAAGRGLAAAVLLAVVAGGCLVAAAMERALALGLVAAGVAAAGQGTPRPRVLTGLAASLAALGAAWAVQLFAADSRGYGVLEAMATRSAWAPAVPWALGGLGLAAAALAPRPAARAAAAALAGAAIAWRPLDPTLPASALLLAPALAGLWTLAPPWPRRWAQVPAALAVPALLAAMLVAHTYATRVFGCPEAPHPALTRVADPGAVFRVALLPDGSPIVAQREARGWSRWDGERLVPLEPHPVPARPADQRAWPGESLASTEELVGGARVFGTVLGGHPDYYSLPTSPPNVVNNQLVELGPDGPIAVHSPEHLCWIGALLPHDGALWAGCEYESKLHRLDADSGAVAATVDDPALGDVAALAATPAGLATASFWRGRRLAIVDPRSAAVVRSAPGPGGHYDLAWEPRAERLWVSSYTRSRLVGFDADLVPQATIPTGLGARALAVDPARGWLLAASVYDGVLRVCEGERVAARLRVGGHVKDIAVDAERGVAWFASRCGLWRLDLAALGASIR